MAALTPAGGVWVANFDKLRHREVAVRPASWPVAMRDEHRDAVSVWLAELGLIPKRVADWYVVNTGPGFQLHAQVMTVDREGYKQVAGRTFGANPPATTPSTARARYVSMPLDREDVARLVEALEHASEVSP